MTEVSAATRVRTIEDVVKNAGVSMLKGESVLWLIEQWDEQRDLIADVRKGASVLEDVPDTEMPQAVKALIDALTYMATVQAAELARKDAVLERIRLQASLIGDYGLTATAADDLQDGLVALCLDGLKMPDPEPPVSDEEGDLRA